MGHGELAQSGAHVPAWTSTRTHTLTQIQGGTRAAERRATRIRTALAETDTNRQENTQRSVHTSTRVPLCTQTRN